MASVRACRRDARSCDRGGAVCVTDSRIFPCNMKVKLVKGEADVAAYGEHCLHLKPSGRRRHWYIRADKESLKEWKACFKVSIVRCCVTFLSPPCALVSVSASSYLCASVRLSVSASLCAVSTLSLLCVRLRASSLSRCWSLCRSLCVSAGVSLFPCVCVSVCALVCSHACVQVRSCVSM
jgi:hypothetical protein